MKKILLGSEVKLPFDPRSETPPPAPAPMYDSLPAHTPPPAGSHPDGSAPPCLADPSSPLSGSPPVPTARRVRSGGPRKGLTPEGNVLSDAGANAPALPVNGARARKARPQPAPTPAAEQAAPSQPAAASAAKGDSAFLARLGWIAPEWSALNEA